jgi:hypothetical protein
VPKSVDSRGKLRAKVAAAHLQIRLAGLVTEGFLNRIEAPSGKQSFDLIVVDVKVTPEALEKLSEQSLVNRKLEEAVRD